MRLNATAASDVGPYRVNNQDAAFAASWGAGVADGVGGGPSGDLASATILHRVTAGLVEIVDEDDLAVRIRSANWDLRAHVRRHPELQGMATTLTAAFFTRSGRLLIAHSGDSRAYRLRGGVLSRQTRDDSLVQALVDSGFLAPDQAARHPQRNIVTGSLGGGFEDRLSVVAVDVRADDRWLMCSDGVSDYLTDEEIGGVLNSPADPAMISRAVVALALEAGSRDNVTAVVADVVPGGLLSDRARYSGSAADWFAEGIEDTA